MEMTRLTLALLVAVPTLLVAGCGGDEAGAPATTEATETSDSVQLVAPPWAGRLLAEQGPESAAVMASSDFAVGTNRVRFLLVRANGSLVERPVADVSYRPRSDGPVRRTVARLVSIGVGAAGKDEVKQIYVATLALPRIGKHWIVVRPRGERFQAFQILDVKQDAAAVAIGDAAPRSENPTTATAPAKELSTARPPNVKLLRYSVADSLERRLPFVLAFATPSFCESRTCGPTLEVVEAVRRRFESRGIRFIHVEIYEDNLPGNGVNRWVEEWKLPTEPWVFVVDRSGVVRDRFEGAVSVGELASSVEQNLLGA